MYISASIPNDSIYINPIQFIFTGILIFWPFFVIVAIGDLKLFLADNKSNRSKKVSKNHNDKISYVAAMLFVGTVIILSNDRFQTNNFCLMNSNDSLCEFDKVNCFRKTSLETVDFDLGKFMKTNTNSTEGIGFILNCIQSLILRISIMVRDCIGTL